mmetsp:Transcript_69556/g.175302  ORF Transcript_69556/g.175302 Transcript_69556/m.175302 type:complete len:108 (-) Transcript_69556:51-374(-)
MSASSAKVGAGLEQALTAENKALDDLKVMMHATMERIEEAVEKLHRDEQHLEREREKLHHDEEDVRERQAEVSRLREELDLQKAKGKGFFCCASKPATAPDIVVHDS